MIVKKQRRAGRTLPYQVAAIITCLFYAGGVNVLAQKQPKSPSPQRNGLAETNSGKSQKRLQFMLKAASRFRFEFPEEKGAEASLHPKALLRWSNPISTVRDGMIGMYKLGDRPISFVEFQMHASGTVIHEFNIASRKAVELKRDGRTIWKPLQRWSVYRELTDAPDPASDKLKRLTQMKRLARRFKVTDQFGWEEDDITPYELRLMPNPVYRYGNSDRVIDAACFIFAQGTNPEAILLLEAVESGDETGWRYLFVPSTIYELTVRLDGKVVWEKPRYKVFGNSKGPYYASRYQPSPDDVDVKQLISD